MSIFGSQFVNKKIQVKFLLEINFFNRLPRPDRIQGAFVQYSQAHADSWGWSCPGLRVGFDDPLWIPSNPAYSVTL